MRLGRRALLGLARLSGRRIGLVIGVIFFTAMPFYRVSGLDAPFGCQAGVLLAVPVLESQLVLGKRLIALAFKVEHAAQIDVGPGQQPR